MSDTLSYCGFAYCWPALIHGCTVGRILRPQRAVGSRCLFISLYGAVQLSYVGIAWVGFVASTVFALRTSKSNAFRYVSRRDLMVIESLA